MAKKYIQPEPVVGGLNPQTGKALTQEDIDNYNAQKSLNYIKGNMSSPYDVSPTSQETESFKGNFNFNDYGFNYEVGDDNIDRRAENQSGWEQWGNGLGKFIGKTATAVAGNTIGLGVGLAEMIQNGDFKSFYDNEFQRSLDKANEYMDETLPNYVSKAQQDYSLLRDMGTANFWANDFLGGMSFTAGAILSEMLTAGAASELMAVKAAKFLNKTAKAADVTADVAKGASTWSKLKSTAGPTARQLAMGAGYEAGVEARNFKDRSMERLISEYKERNNLPEDADIDPEILKQFEDETNTMGNGVFAANFALVSASNFITLPKVFNRGVRNGANIIDNTTVRATKDLTEQELKTASKNLGREITEPYINAYHTLTRGEKIASRTLKAMKSPFMEGVVEEGGQGIIQNSALEYISKQFDPNATLETKSLATAMGNAFNEQFTTKDGWKEMIIGMMIGGVSNVFQDGFSKNKKENEKIDKYTTWMNQNPDLVKNTKLAFQDMIRQNKAAKKQDAAMSIGDMFETKNAEFDSFFSYVASRHGAGYYDTIKEDVVTGIEKLSDQEFKDQWLQDENVTLEEAGKRKQELVKTTLQKAEAIKRSLDLINENVHFREYSDDVKLGAAYSLAKLDNLDNRELSIKDELVKLVGGDTNLIAALNKKIDTVKYQETLKNPEVQKYIKFKEQLEKLQSDDAQAKKEAVEEDINALRKEIAKQIKISGLDESTLEKGYDYYKSTKEFNNATKAWLEQNENSPNKNKVVQNIIDLERLQDERTGVIDEYNRLNTKEGKDKFEQKTKEAREKLFKELGIYKDPAALMLLASDKITSLQELQEALYSIKANEIKGIASQISDSTKAGNTAFNIQTNDEEVQEFINSFSERLKKLPQIDDTDSLDERIKKVENIISEYNSTLKELGKKLKDTKGTIKGEEYEKVLEALTLALNELKAQLNAFKKAKPVVEKGVVVEYPHDIGEFYTAFEYEGKAETEALISTLTDSQLRGINVRTKFEVHKSDKESTDLPTPNPNITRATLSNGRNILITSTHNGQRIVLGSLYDPRGFKVNGQPLNAKSINHIKEFNPKFVANNTLTEEGREFQHHLLALIKQFEAIDKVEAGDSIPFDSDILLITNTNRFIHIDWENRTKVGDKEHANKVLTVNLGTNKNPDNKDLQVIVESYKEKGTVVHRFYVKQEDGTFKEAEGALNKKLKDLIPASRKNKADNTDRYALMVNNNNSKFPVAVIYLSHDKLDNKADDTLIPQLINKIQEHKKKATTEKAVNSETIIGGSNSEQYFTVKYDTDVSIRLDVSGNKGKGKEGELSLSVSVKNKDGEWENYKSYLKENNIFHLFEENGKLYFQLKGAKDKVEIKTIEDLNSFLEKAISDNLTTKDKDNKLKNVRLKGSLKLTGIANRVQLDNINNLKVNSNIKTKFYAKGADFKPAEKKETKKEESKEPLINSEAELNRRVVLIEKAIKDNKVPTDIQKKIWLDFKATVNKSTNKNVIKKGNDIVDAKLKELNKKAPKTKTEDVDDEEGIDFLQDVINEQTGGEEVEGDEKTSVDEEGLSSKKQDIINLIELHKANGNFTEAARIAEENEALLNGEDAPPFRLSEGESAEVSIVNATETLKRILPIKSAENPKGIISIDELDVLLKNIKTKKIPFGAFKDATIYLANKSAVGTEYHEAFHAVFRLLLTDDQITLYLKEAEKEFGTPTESQLKELRKETLAYGKLSKQQLKELWLEEKLADRFQKYSVKRSEIESNSTFQNLWKKILKFLGLMNDVESEIDLLFNDIYSGNFKNANAKYNIFARNSNIKNTVFSLLKNDVGGYLTSSQSERLINTIALKVAKKQVNNPAKDLGQLFNEAYSELLEYYTLENWTNDFDRLSDVKKEKAVSQLGTYFIALRSAENILTIKKEVDKRISLFNLTKDEDESIEESNEQAERSFDLSSDNVGGIGSISKEMRQYIAFTTVGVDEFGIGLTEEELENPKYQLAGNPYQVYEGIVRVLSNTTNKQMLLKLREYIKYNKNAAGFYKKLTADISEQVGLTDDIDSYITNTDILKESNIYNKFIVAFKNSKFKQDMILFDPLEGEYNRFNANTKDVDVTQYTKWSKNYTDKYPEFSEDAVNIVNEIIDLFFNTDVIRLGVPNVNIGNFNSDDSVSIDMLVSEIANNFNKLGINLSEGYIKYNLLLNNKELIEAALTDSKVSDAKKEELTEGLNYINLFEGVESIDKLFLERLVVSIQSSTGTPFKETAAKEGGSIGSLKKIAKGNAVFDESVSSSTYQNAEGKTIYDKVKNSFYLEDTQKLKIVSNALYDLINSVNEGSSIEEAEQGLIDIYNEVEKTLEPYQAKYLLQVFINNPLFTQLAFNEFSAMFKELNIKGISGIRQTNLSKNEDGEIVSNAIGSTVEEGMDYGSLDLRGKMLIDLINFLESSSKLIYKDDKNIIKKPLAAIRIGTNEAKNTTYTIDVPVQDFYINGAVTPKGLSWLKSLLKQEYERIQLVQTELGKTTDVIDGVHNKDEKTSKGTKFFNFNTFNVKLENQLLNKALSGASFEETFNELDINTQMNNFINEQIGEYINKLKSSDVELILENEKGILNNNLLPKDYFIKNELNTDLIGQFFLNDYLYSYSFNSLLKGDLALSHKSIEEDIADVPKRNAQNVASGPDFGSGQTNIAIFKSLKTVTRELEDLTKEINGIEKTDTTDAQSINTINWYINTYLKSQGKYVEAVKPILNKLKRGFDITWSEYQVLKKFNCDLRPRKIVGSSTFMYLKTSSHTLSRNLVSIKKEGINNNTINRLYDELDRLEEKYYLDKTSETKEEINKLYKTIHETIWRPLPGKELLHNLLNKMELENIDIVAADSAVKTMKIDVGSVNIKSNNWNLTAHPIDNNILREQVITDNSKQEIVDSTQKMNLIWGEQNENLIIDFNGKKVKIGNITSGYKHLLASRIKKGFSDMRKTLYRLKEIEGKDLVVTERNFKYLLDSFKNSLEASGTDPYLMELFQSDTTGVNAKYNLNFPAILSKYEAMYLSYISKQTTKQKAPGHKFTLVSEAGYNIAEIDGKIVTNSEIKKDPSLYNKVTRTRRLQYNKLDPKTGKYYSEIAVAPQFIELLNLKIGDYISNDAPLIEIKPGVSELFDSNSELANIGTPEQYSQYLDTIFPDSKVRDIVYHGTDAVFEKFKPTKPKFDTLNSIEGVYNFTTNKEFSKRYGKNILSTILNINNPIQEKTSGEFIDDMDRPLSEGLYKIGKKKSDNILAPKYDKSLKNTDAVINRIEGDNYALPVQTVISVFEPEQIHILGSKQDIEGFKKFVTSDINKNFNNKLILNKLLDMIGVRIPTQDLHSMGSLRIVELLPVEYGNSIMMPLELIALSGADFDIDSLYTRIFQSIKSIFGENKISFYGDYLKDTTKDSRSIVSKAFHEYLNYYSRSDKRVYKEAKEIFSNDATLNVLTYALNRTISEYSKISTELNTNTKNTIDEFLDKMAEIKLGENSDGEVVQEISDIIAEKYGKDISSYNDVEIREFLEHDLPKLLRDLNKNDVTKINEFKKKIQEIKTKIETIKRTVFLSTLTKHGYKTDFNSFNSKFGKEVINNYNNYNTGNFSKVNPITNGETNNLLLELEQSLVTNEGNKHIQNEPVSLDIFQRLREYYNNELNLKPQGKNYGVYSPLDKAKASNSNDVGKQGIAPAAVFNVMMRYLNKYEVNINRGKDEQGNRLFQPIKLGGIEYDNFNSLTNEDGRIFASLSTILSAMTDNAKERFAAEFNLSTETLGAALFLVGTGIPLKTVINLMKQPAVVEYANTLTKIKSPIKAINEKYLNSSNAYENILTKYKVEDSKEDIELNNTNLEYGLLDNTDDKFKLIQYKALKEFKKAYDYSNELINLTKILQLSKGFKSTWAEFDGVLKALNDLGYDLEVLKSKSGNNYSDYKFVRIKDNTTFDLFKLLEDDFIKTNLISAKIAEKDSGNFFILQTKTGKEIFNSVQSIISDRAFLKSDTNNNIRRSIISYLATVAYRHSNKKNYQIKDLFGDDLAKALISIRTKYPNNTLLKYLDVLDSDKIESITKGCFKGEKFFDIKGDTRTKNNPDFQKEILNGFKQLVSSKDASDRAFATALFDRIMMRDQMQFRNNGLVKIIEPALLKGYLGNLNKIEKLFSNNEGTFEEVFGLSKDKLISEFIELYARYIGNTSDLVNNNYTNIANIVTETMQNRKGDAAKVSPIYFDDYNNIQSMTVNVWNGAFGKKETKQENLNLLKDLKIFSQKPLDEYHNIYFPQFIAIYKKTKDEYGEYSDTEKILLKRTSLTIPKEATKETIKEGYGMGATYERVSAIGSKSILPYAFTVAQFDKYLSEKDTDEFDPFSDEDFDINTYLTDDLKSIGTEVSKSGDRVQHTEDVPAPKARPGFIIIGGKEIELANEEDVDIDKEQKESRHQSVSKETAEVILNKLADKLSINWKWDTTIKGLGKFKNGVVYINPNNFKLDTLFHEFAHPFVHAIKYQNPLLYRRLVEEARKHNALLKRTRSIYPELSEEDVIEEVIVQLVGERSSDIYINNTASNPISLFWKRVFEILQELFGTSIINIKNLNPNTFMDSPISTLGYLLNLDNKINLSNFTEYKNISESDIDNALNNSCI